MNDGVRRGLVLWAWAVVVGVAWGLVAFANSSQVATVVGTVCAVVALLLLVVGGVVINRGLRDQGQ